MTKARHHIDTYLEGWRLGDGNMSLGATAPEFFYDDPNTGRISRKDFLRFFEDFRSAVDDGKGSASGEPFLTYTDVVITENSVPHKAWCWWQATGTDFQGSALIYFGDHGVISEKIAYFSRLP
jgi:hypothetical protein